MQVRARHVANRANRGDTERTIANRTRAFSRETERSSRHYRILVHLQLGLLRHVPRHVEVLREAVRAAGPPRHRNEVGVLLEPFLGRSPYSAMCHGVNEVSSVATPLTSSSPLHRPCLWKVQPNIDLRLPNCVLASVVVLCIEGVEN